MGREINPRRAHQDTVFRMIFSEKENAIELFNALEGTDYGPDTEVEFTTLEDAVYASLKNDLGFIIDKRFIVLTEHQSTINNNMPLRQLEYISRTYEKLIDAAALYGSRKVMLPTPEFFVIYTGSRDWGVQELRLSDSFLHTPPENSAELVVKIINVRYNKNNKILEKSRSLRGYSLLLEYIAVNRRNGLDLKEAIDEAIRRCLKEGILEEFLSRNSPEVGSVIFKEITSEEFAEIRAKEAAEESFQKGLQQGEASGREKACKEGIANLIDAYREFGYSKEQTEIKLKEKYPAEDKKIQDYIQEYWK